MVYMKCAGIALVALIYFVSPIDLIVDVIPFVGWIDDAFVIKWACSSISGLLAPPASKQVA